MIVLLLLAGLLPQASSRPVLGELREHLLAGDFVAVEKARAILAESGEDVATGGLGLLGDLTRLARCLPIGPIPPRETRTYRAARLLVRLERIRLEGLLQDGKSSHATDLDALLLSPSLFGAPKESAASKAANVRWPIEDERWEGEVVDLVPEPTACASRAVALKDRGDKDKERTLLRARSERVAIAALIPYLSDLPEQAAARVALAYLGHAESAKGFDLPADWHPPLESALIKGADPERTAGLMLLATLKEKCGDFRGAAILYRRLLADPSTTKDQDSRARARLVGLLEPDWVGVLDVARGAKKPRPEDVPIFDNAIARALYGLEDWHELQTFGRTWLRSGPPENEWNQATRDLIVRVGLKLKPSEALAWIDEIGPDNVRDRTTRLDDLGQVALSSGYLDLAALTYDRLRIEAAASRVRAGAVAAIEEARWLSARAAIEYEREDPETFGGFIGEILLLARVEQSKPLARHAPHREIARLTQDLLGRLTNDVAGQPERRKFAAHLLEAATALQKNSGRWGRALAEIIPALRILAGPYATGARAAQTAQVPTRRVRRIGEIVIPRLPARLTAPDLPTPHPSTPTFLVFEDPDGTWRTGAFWTALAERRRYRP